VEFTLLWQALLAVVAALGVARLQQRRGLVPAEVGLGDRILGAAVMGLLVGRLTSMLLQGVNPFLSPSDILIVRGGVDTAAASIAALATLAWSLRADLWHSFDAAAPAVLLGLAGWQAGCLFRSACLGASSTLPWAWAQPGSPITRHPTELYAAGLLAIAAVIAFGSAGRWRPGVLAGSALVVAALSRLITQPLRPAIDETVVGWYVAGILVGLLLVVTRHFALFDRGDQSSRTDPAA
jgi:prolipoprotein diacylglyceryltransferase